MTRILILIVLIWILYQIIKRVIVTARAENARQNAEQKTSINEAEKMLQCAHCGCHVPESETKVVNHLIVCNNPACSKITHGD